MARRNRKDAALGGGAAQPAAAEDKLRGLLEQAQERLDSGHNGPAEKLLRRAVRLAPQDSTALLLLGLAIHRQNKPQKAVPVLQRAASLAPEVPETHFQLANALKLCGDRDAAVEAYSRALTLRPDFAEAYRELGLLLILSGLNDQAAECLQLALQFDPEDALTCFNLGILQGAQGRAQAAFELYARAATIDPSMAGAHINMGNIVLEHGKPEAAAKCYQRAIDAEPRDAVAHANLARALREQGNLEGAEAAARKAVSFDPSLWDGHNNLGNALKDQGKLEEAVACYKKAIALKPGNAVYRFNLGDVLHQLRRYQQAAAAFEKALELDPDLAVACNNYGLVLVDMGRRNDALELFRRAVALQPDHDGYKCSLSMCLMALGHKKEALALADHCFVCGLRAPNRVFGRIPRWRGEDLTGKRLLIWREQGVGDELRFSQRYEQAIAVAGECIIEADRRLVGLFQQAYPTAEVRPENQANDATRDDADYHVPAGGLEEFFPKSHCRLHGGREVHPYLSADPAREAFWRERLAALGPGLKVGICWRSSLSGRLRDPMYCHLTDWAELFKLEGLQFINLQYDDCEAELREAEEACGIAIHRLEGLDLRDDFEEVFALTAGLDLVISAGTAVADIATARGVPLWLFGLGARRPDFKPHRLLNANTIFWTRHAEEGWPEIFDRMAVRMRDQVVGSTEIVDDPNSLHRALMLGTQPWDCDGPTENKIPSADLTELFPDMDPEQELVLPEGDWASNPNIKALAALAGHLAPGLAIEFGTCQGASAYAVSKNAGLSARIFTVEFERTSETEDYLDGWLRGDREPGRLLCDDAEAGNVSQLRRPDSRDLPSELQGLEGQADLVVVQGIRSYEDYLANVETAGCFVAPKGIVVFHHFGHERALRGRPPAKILNELAMTGAWVLRHVLGTQLVLGFQPQRATLPGQVIDFEE